MSRAISASNKRIAVNTVIVYTRLFVTMIVGLLTTRYVLQALGKSDFGLYNVVGSILAMLTFISGSMSSTTTRFINYEEGKKEGNTNRIFNVCLIIHIIVACILLLLAETVGVYYIRNYLKVATDMEQTAMFVFQVSIVISCIGIINVPYQGLLNAKEKFSWIAIIEITNSILKLVLVLLLFLFKHERLRIYAVFMSVMTCVSFIAFHWICYSKWPTIVKKNFKQTKGHFKEIIVYNNYNLLGTASLTLRDQGSNVIINYFFGTVVNAAYAIARNIQHFVNVFAACMDSAAAPQITQNFSRGNTEKSTNLAGMVGRLCILLMGMIVFPLYVELNYILRFWLGDSIPDGTLIFAKLTLMLVYISGTSAGLLQYIHASGKIKWFKIEMAIWYIGCLPVAIYGYHNGWPFYTMIILFICADILNRSTQLLLLKIVFNFNSWSYVKEAYFRPFIISIIMILSIFILRLFIPYCDGLPLLNIIIIFLLVTLLNFYIGMKANERFKMISMIRNILRL